MAGRLSDAWLDELRSRVPLEEVVSEYVPLKQKGRRYWGCCPFHREKTPSFAVNTESQMYYCFGCHKAGTVITFIQEMERLEFMDSVKLLAERAHMELPELRTHRDSISTDDRERIYEANTLAARFFHSLLWTEEGAEALNYLYRRGLNDGDIRRFGLGASPKGWSTLSDKLTKEGFSQTVLEKAGLMTRKEGRTYDMFRGRAMFPIINQQGRVVGFGGRVMGDGQPKYLNTAETPVFNKRQGLYCLNLAKKEREIGHLVLVEGYMDTVSLRRNGVQGVVATLGTALTEEQVRLFKRFTPEVWISYDGDGAGQKAALRALDMFDEQGMVARVIDYPKGMDPDDYVKAYGKEGFEALPRYGATEYRMLRARDGLDLNTQEGNTEYAKRCCEAIRKVRSPIEADNYIRRLAQETGYDRDVLMRQIGMQQARTERASIPRTEPRISEEERSVEISLNEQILLTLLGEGVLPEGMVSKDDFSDGFSARLAGELLSGRKPVAVMDELEDEALRKVAAQALNYSPIPEDPDDARDMAENVLTEIRRDRILARMKEIEKRLPSATKEEKDELYRQILLLTDQLNTL